MALFLENEKPSKETNYTFRLEHSNYNTVNLYVKNSDTEDELYIAEFSQNDDGKAIMQVDAWAVNELGIKLLKILP